MWKFYYIDTSCIFEFILTNILECPCKVFKSPVNRTKQTKLFILMKLQFSRMQTQYIKIKWPFSVCKKKKLAAFMLG